MAAVDLNLTIVFILAIGFTWASVLGYFSNKMGLSPLLGYLVAGYFIGPYFPGYTADTVVAEQLAEIGVVFMLFSVGLHFKWQELVKTGKTAIPGALGQLLLASLAAFFSLSALGMNTAAAAITALATSIASTVVVVRVLEDNSLLATHIGHLSVGWLIIEDIIMVIALLFLPLIKQLSDGNSISLATISLSLALTFIKFSLLLVIMFTIGKKIVKWILTKVAKAHSHELFTLTILAITFLIASGSTVIFGTSIALGAFIAGLVMRETDVRHEVSTNTQSLKDMFIVLFFLSAGMLFDPMTILKHYEISVAVLIAVLIFKPLATYGITLLIGESKKTALLLAVVMAQIGEFSFILAEEANRYRLLPDEAFDAIVASALLSIAINPPLFRMALKQRHAV